MNKTNASVHRIFREINHILWSECERPAHPDPYGGSALDIRAKRIAAEGERQKSIIAAYIDSQTTMMQKLIRKSGFSRFPLPGRRIPLWSQIRARLALWWAIRSWPCGMHRDS